MKKENSVQDDLLEIYKLYVQMTDNVSARRLQINAFFISVLSALLATLVFMSQSSSLSDKQDIAFIAISLLGLLVCIVWFLNLASYRQLNSGKFKVIQNIEKQLPYRCYTEEWELLGQGKDAKRYRRLTHSEQFVPVILCVPFLLILAYGVYSLLLL